MVIRVRATSLNYRDHLIVTGQYFSGVVDRDVILLSDGAGEVVAAGPGVTAWNALTSVGTRVKAGDTVLCQGTGGVSMLAMQFALAAGARVIVARRATRSWIARAVSGLPRASTTGRTPTGQRKYCA